MLSNVPIKWCSQIKYLGVYINAGKKFDVSTDVSRRKFLGSVLAILQKCGSISEEIKCHLIQHSCPSILCYKVDALKLHKQKVHELSVTYDTSIRKCFHLSRFVSVRLILHYTGSFPMKILLHERYILLVKDCLGVSSVSVLKMCALIASNESDFNDVCRL